MPESKSSATKLQKIVAENDKTKERSSGNVVLGGVGGQGVITASNTISFACIDAGFDVKKSEVHGMSQRGGSVVSHLRFGREVHSVMVELGKAEWILGFEWEEGLRYLGYLKPGGVAFISVERRIPPSAQVDRRTGSVMYPYDVSPPEGVVPIDTYEIAGSAAEGRPAIAQTVLLGALSVEMGFDEEVWRRAIAATVPSKYVEDNLICFDRGRAWYEEIKRTGGKSKGTISAAYGNGRTAGTVATLSGHAVGSTTGLRISTDRGKPRVEITRSWCKGCNICVAVCPERILVLDRHEIAVLSDPDRCTGCGLCARMCPDLAIEVWLDSFAGNGSLKGSAAKLGEKQ